MNQATAQQQDPIIKLVLPLSQVNVLLQGASSLPWNQANGVISNVHGQVGAQLNQEPEAQPAAAKAERAAPAPVTDATPAPAVTDSAPPSAE